MRRLRVLLDTDVLVDAQIRDLFLTAADWDLIEYRWTEAILGELHRALVAGRNLEPAAAARLCNAIRREFADGEVVDYVPLPTVDPGDAHVLGAAVAGSATFS